MKGCIRYVKKYGLKRTLRSAIVGLARIALAGAQELDPFEYITDFQTLHRHHLPFSRVSIVFIVELLVLFAYYLVTLPLCHPPFFFFSTPLPSRD